MNEELSLRLRFYADQETAILDTQEEMRGRVEELVAEVKVAEVKYEAEVKEHEVSKRTIQNLLGKVERADLKYEREVRQHEVSKRTIRNLLEKVEFCDLRYEREIQQHEVAKRTIRELLETLSEEINNLKEENTRMKDQRASIQSLWQKRSANHNQAINTLNAVVKTFVATQGKLSDKWVASDAAMDLKFKEYLLDSASGVQEGVTNGAILGSDSSDGMVETPPAKKRKFQASVEDCED
ncbi:predicted protein [Sclerotinia sclerotiorum 1980 UF-70]|uniref:Uncharacterized protein n=1 Tax=Sclerotinia sclerotiorum (strain ATCC 18683 / 1980 / Ss-1) TaxID=665079 RepID=A7EFS6_SCLS1|nr:predicted protein [Sclerotinia sclerotiorum 1980 UF-70]EDO01692.1 predicted protein [Sclerotinia sclerotiorum 1980 UF-70]